MVVFSVTDESSLSAAENSLYQVTKLDQREKSVMLVANKADLIKTRVVHPTGQLAHHSPFSPDLISQ